MRIFSLKVLLCLSMSLLLAGCGAADSEAWKNTKEFYYSYVNTPTVVDVSSPESLKSEETQLVNRIMPIDQQITMLERILDAVSGVPDQAYVQDMQRRLPWISSFVMVAPTGEVLDSIPSPMMKELDFAWLTEANPNVRPRALRAHVQESPLGAEVMIARPVYQGTELALYFVVTFDPRTLLPFSAEPNDIIMRTPELLLWSGDAIYSDTALADTDWNNLLRKESFGKITKNGHTMVWLVRYVGTMPLIFATTASASDK